MESTGSYWVPVFNILEGHFIIVLANPEEVKNRKGHKTDPKDAEHLAELLTRPYPRQLHPAQAHSRPARSNSPTTAIDTRCDAGANRVENSWNT